MILLLENDATLPALPTDLLTYLQGRATAGERFNAVYVSSDSKTKMAKIKVSNAVLPADSLVANTIVVTDPAVITSAITWGTPLIPTVMPG